MSTCGEVGSDVHALIKELAIRRAEHRSETHSNKGTEVARLRRRFSFVLQQALSFRTRHHLCRQGVALASTRQLRSQGPVSVDTHRTEGVTGSEGREGANGGGIGVGCGNGDGNGVRGGNVNGDGDGAGAGTGTGTGVEANEGVQDGDGAGTGTGVETRGRTQDGDGNESTSGDGDEDRSGNEDMIGEGGREAKKRKIPHKSCRRHVGNGVLDLGGKRKKRRKERVGQVAAKPDNLENNKEARGEST